MSVPREAIRDLILRHPEPRASLSARSGVCVRTIQRILYGTRSGGTIPRYRGEMVDLDVADRICIALGEQLPD